MFVAGVLGLNSKIIPVYPPPPGTGRGGEAHFRKATVITGRAFLLFTLLLSWPGKTQLDGTFSSPLVHVAELAV